MTSRRTKSQTCCAFIKSLVGRAPPAAVSAGLVIVGLLSTGCGDDQAAVDPPAADAEAPPPRMMVDPPPPAVAVARDDASDAGWADVVGADAYSLPPNSLTTCGQYFDCLRDCPEAFQSCHRGCHDAMTVEAASDVQYFISCMTRNSCASGGCATMQCGREIRACFGR